MFWVSRKNRLPLTVALLVGLIVLSIVFNRAHGAKPDAGATYRGTVIVQSPDGRQVARLAISFAVTRPATAVENFRFIGGLPRLCRNRSVGSVVSSATRIVTPSHFVAHLPILRGGTRTGTLTITGTFHEIDREVGALQTRFTVPSLRGCAAQGGYTTSS